MHKQNYIDTMKTAINTKRGEVERALNSLEEKSDDIRFRATRSLHELKDELNELDKKLDRLGEIADDTWQNIREDLDGMWDRMGKELSHVQNEISDFNTSER